MNHKLYEFEYRTLRQEKEPLLLYPIEYHLADKKCRAPEGENCNSSVKSNAEIRILMQYHKHSLWYVGV